LIAAPYIFGRVVIVTGLVRRRAGRATVAAPIMGQRGANQPDQSEQ
jgi:hypothetical protein